VLIVYEKAPRFRPRGAIFWDIELGAFGGKCAA